MTATSPVTRLWRTSVETAVPSGTASSPPRPPFRSRGVGAFAVVVLAAGVAMTPPAAGPSRLARICRRLRVGDGIARVASGAAAGAAGSRTGSRAAEGPALTRALRCATAVTLVTCSWRFVRLAPAPIGKRVVAAASPIGGLPRGGCSLRRRTVTCLACAVGNRPAARVEEAVAGGANGHGTDALAPFVVALAQPRTVDPVQANDLREVGGGDEAAPRLPAVARKI